MNDFFAIIKERRISNEFYKKFGKLKIFLNIASFCECFLWFNLFKIVYTFFNFAVLIC